MAVFCRMSTIQLQYSARRACSYTIYCLSPFRHVDVLTFAVLVCRRFDHTPTSPGMHAHLDRQRYDLWHGVSCHSWMGVGRRWKVAVGFLYGSYSPEECSFQVAGSCYLIYQIARSSDLKTTPSEKQNALAVKYINTLDKSTRSNQKSQLN